MRTQPFCVIALASMLVVSPARSQNEPTSGPRHLGEPDLGQTATTASAARLPAGIEAERQVRRILERSRSIRAKDMLKTEDELATALAVVDRLPRTVGARVAHRLSTEFGVSTAELEAEHTQFGARWGDLVIAHTLEANLHAGPTARQLLKLHDYGVGWSRIAYALGFDLGDLVGAARLGARIAAGQTKADGKVALMRGMASPPSALGVWDSQDPPDAPNAHEADGRATAAKGDS